MKHGPQIRGPCLICSSMTQRALQKRLYSAKETYDFKEPTLCSHPIRPESNVKSHMKPGPQIRGSSLVLDLECSCMTHSCVRRDSFMCVCHECVAHTSYGVAAVSRLLKIIGLFCRISSFLWGSFAKETHNFKEPANCSHPISRQDHL